MQQGDIACGRGTLESSPPPQKTLLALALTIPAFQEGQPYTRLNYGGLFYLVYDLFCVKSNRLSSKAGLAALQDFLMVWHANC